MLKVEPVRSHSSSFLTKRWKVFIQSLSKHFNWMKITKKNKSLMELSIHIVSSSNCWNTVKKESRSSAHMFSYGIFFNASKQKMVHLWKRLDMCDKKLLKFFAACRFFNYLQIIDFLWLQTWQKLLKFFAMCNILMCIKFQILWVMKYRY